MKYTPLYEVMVTHAYYEKGLCRDFDIVPSEATRGLLRNHRCLIRHLPNGIRIMTQAFDDNQPMIPISETQTFVFHLKLKNPHFSKFTDLSEFANHQPPLFCNDTTNTDKLQQLKLSTKQEWKTDHFVVDEPDAAGVFLLNAKPIAELNGDSIDIAGTEQIINAADFTAQANAINIDTSGGQRGQQFTAKYEIPAKLAQGVFADIEIHYQNSVDATTDDILCYEIPFQPKQAYWAYYIVTDDRSAKFRIVDSNKLPNYKKVVFRARDSIRLDKLGDNDKDKIAEKLAAKFSDKLCWRFISSERILCHEKIRKLIQLLSKGQDTEEANALIEHLPNPKPKNHSYIKRVLKDRDNSEDVDGSDNADDIADVDNSSDVQELPIVYEIIQQLINA